MMMIVIISRFWARAAFSSLAVRSPYAVHGFFTYSSVHFWPFPAQHVSFLALRPSTGWHAR